MLLRIVFAIYAILCAWSMTHHGLWSDEAHSWNIAKSSTNYGDLLCTTLQSYPNWMQN
jgi:hypothetical protein